jgi:hypothetical protein
VIALERTESGVRARALAESLRSLSWLSAFGTAEAFSRSTSERRR